MAALEETFSADWFSLGKSWLKALKDPEKDKPVWAKYLMIQFKKWEEQSPQFSPENPLFLGKLADLYSFYSRYPEHLIRCKKWTSDCGPFGGWATEYTAKLDYIYNNCIIEGSKYQINIGATSSKHIEETQKGIGEDHRWQYGDKEAPSYYTPDEIFKEPMRDFTKQRHAFNNAWNGFIRSDEYTAWAGKHGKEYIKWKAEKEAEESTSSASAQYNYFNEMIGIKKEQHFIGGGQGLYDYSPHHQFVDHHQYDSNDYMYYNNNDNILIIEFGALIITFIIITITLLVISCICLIYYIKKQTKPTKPNQKEEDCSYSDPV